MRARAKMQRPGAPRPGAGATKRRTGGRAGEDAAAGDAEAGVGVYKSTNGGDTWTPLGGNANFVNRAVRNITVDQFDPTGNTIWIADGRGVHGISSTTAGAVSAIPNSPGVGIWKSTDGGASFTLAQ